MWTTPLITSHRTIKAGEKHDIPVSLCGEMAGNVRYTRLLLGLGLKLFSMDATYLLDVKEHVLQADVSRLKKKVGRILKADSPLIAKEQLSRLNKI